MAKCTISKHQQDNLEMDKLLTIHPPEIMIIALKICEFDVEKPSFKVLSTHRLIPFQAQCKKMAIKMICYYIVCNHRFG